jgi:osmoprotectant transport system substrate-binding protein
MGSRRVVVIAVAVIAMASWLSACGAGTSASIRPAAPNDGTITVGSFDFAESRLLAEVYSQAFEAQGLRVHRALDLGPREFVAPALANGLIEFLPEYAGTALRFVSLDAQPPEADVDATHRALVDELKARGMTALDAAPAQDANAFVVTRETAERYGLHRLSDLTDVASELTFGGPPECASRPLCLVGLKDVYGLEFSEFVSLDAGGPLSREALDNDVVDVALLFTTDPALTNPDLVQLEDDRGLQPAENVTPLVRTAVADRSGAALARAANAVSERLTTEVLRDLNAQVAREGSDVAAVAAQWLDQEKLA